MDHLEFLFAGFAVFWAGLFVYLLTLQFRLRALMREMDRLEERLAEYEADEHPTAPSTAAPPDVASQPPRRGALDAPASATTD